MDNDNYTQQFRQNVQTDIASAANDASQRHIRLLTVIIAALSVVLVVESIALTFVFIQYSNLINEEPVIDQELVVESPGSNDTYAFDKDQNLISVKTTCANPDGKYLVLDHDNTIKEYDSADTLFSTDTYTIVHDDLITLASDKDRVLYFGDGYIADGLDVYNCSYATSSTE